MANRGVRDQMVIATKYTTAWRAGFGEKETIVNTGGNGAKSLRTSLEESLKNFRTSYIDLVGCLPSSGRSLANTNDSFTFIGGTSRALFLSSCIPLTTWSPLERSSTLGPRIHQLGSLRKQISMLVIMDFSSFLCIRGSGLLPLGISSEISFR